MLRAQGQSDNLRPAREECALSGLRWHAYAAHRRAVGGLLIMGFAILGFAMALTACGSSGTPAGSSSSSGVVTTVAGGDTCDGRAGRNEASPEFYQQQYASGLANQLKEKLQNYDSAVDSGDPKRIGDTANALDTEIRADARLVNIPRLFGCYNPRFLTALQSATDAFASTMDTVSCAGVNMCNRKQSEVPELVAQAEPQERTYVAAINAYAAQFGGEQLPVPRTPPT